MRRSWKPWLVWMLLAWSAATSVVEAGAWKVFNQMSGLPSSNVFALSVFKNRMAVGTSQGAAVYDGIECVWQNVELPGEVASSAVRDLAYDERGNLWLATPSGIYHVQPNNVAVYALSDGLPNRDCQRLQVTPNEVYAGFFGGFIARATFIPDFGKTTFRGLNFESGNLEDERHLRSIEISGMAFNETGGGWVSTKGRGISLLENQSEKVFDTNFGLTSDWVEAFWRFVDKDKHECVIVGTNEGLTLLRDRNLHGKVFLPSGAPWITSLTVVKPEGERDKPKDIAPAYVELFDFLQNRVLWVGTRDEGLWRFQDGKWTHFDQSNSNLPSLTITRLYVVEGRLAACTPGGLVLIPLASQDFDEFQKAGVPSQTGPLRDFFPAEYPWSPYRIIVAAKDFWVSADTSLARFPLGRKPSTEMLTKESNLSASMEVEKKDQKPSADRPEDDPQPSEHAGEQVESPGWKVYSRKDNTMPYPVITRMVAEDGGGVWLAFKKTKLCRVRVTMNPARKKPGDPFRPSDWLELDVPYVPWPAGQVLSGIGFINGELYVGTAGSGFHILENPDHNPADPKGYRWRSYGRADGLDDLVVLAFAPQTMPDGSHRTLLLHPNAVSFWDKQGFSHYGLDAMALNTCLAVGPDGVFWVGTTNGLYRFTEFGSPKRFCSINADFESNDITAVAVTGGGPNGFGLWVACDEEPWGFDPKPWDTDMTHLKRIAYKNLDDIGAMDGTSLHYFDGLTWDKWWVSRILSLAVVDDTLWMGTMQRLRQLRMSAWINR